MMGIYLSGTGNTKHCVEKLVNLLDAAAECIPLEAPHVTETLEMQSTIILGYPTQFSNAPFMVRDFIRKNRCLWNGKSVFCLNTMGLFSGDGTGCAARLLKKYGAQILGGVQIKMPDSVCDNKLLKKAWKKTGRSSNAQISVSSRSQNKSGGGNIRRKGCRQSHKSKDCLGKGCGFTIKRTDTQIS